MNALIRGWRYAAVAALTLGLLSAAACSASDASTGSGEDAVTDEELSIEFPTMYSAFGGSQDFQLPVHVGGVKNVKFSADPSDAIKFEKQDDDTGTTYMMTVKKFVAKVTITAKVGSLKSTADLNLTESTDDLWQQGSERYNNGVVFKGGGNRGDGGGGGRPDGGWGKGERTVDKSLACTNCHNKGGKGGSDVEHTPTQTAGYSDEDLVNIFTKAQKPSWAKMRTTTLAKWQKIHQWTMEEDEKAGLVVYLRSLTPESQGELDFGGGIFGKGGGGGKHHDDGDSKGSKDKPATDDKDDKAATN